MSAWKIWVPTAATNIVFNPSAEQNNTNIASFGGSSITYDTTQARYGDYSLKIVPGGTNRGASWTTQAAANAIHYATFYVAGTISGTLQVTTNAGSNYNAAAIIGGSTGGWVRYGAQIPAAQANGSALMSIRNTANETWYVDAVQLEQSSYYTTYIDGDRRYNTGGLRGLYNWTGHRNASTSTRDAQERGGGIEYDLLDNYGLDVIQYTGAGLAPVINNTQGLALLPGAAFQSTKTLPRTVALTASLVSPTLAGLHSLRKALIDLIKPDGVRGAQPFVLGYTGSNSGKPVYCQFRYADGLGLGVLGQGETFLELPVPIVLTAVDPYWWEDNRETASLGFVDTLTNVNRVLGRVNGRWGKLGTGFNNTCYSSAYDPTTGRIYFGGTFTTANGVTVNSITYWDPRLATFVAMDLGVEPTKQVLAIAIAPNGDVWIGGNFTTVGTAAVAAKGLAKWTLATGAWSVPTATSAGFASVNSLVIDSLGNLYGGGSFTTFAGIASTLNIWKYDGSAFTALGTGANGTVAGMAVWIDGTSIYIAGTFTTANGVTVNRSGYWNGTTFVAIGGGLNGGATCVTIARNGNVYYGGSFTASVTTTTSMSFIGMWNGTSWAPLSTGATGSTIYSMTFGPDGLLYVCGFYNTIGPFITTWPGVWNGSSWQLLDLNTTSGTPQVLTITALPNGDLYEGDDTAGTRIVGSATVSPTNTNTVSVYPTFTLFGPTSGTCTLQGIQNLATNQIMQFNLTINTGEVIGIDLTPGSKVVASVWRGYLPGQPLPTSDFANWRLQPTRSDGAAGNSIVNFVTGTTTGAVFVMHWPVVHWSVDGAAA